MSAPRLVLASSSPRRRELLAALGLSFRVLKPEIDETQHPAESAQAYVKRLAHAKAQAVATRLEADEHVLAADTVVILAADTTGYLAEAEGEVLGKPADADEARTMLKRLRGRAHWVCTAFCLRDVAGERQHLQLVSTQVQMRAYSDAELEAYIATGDPFDKAGSYAIQHPTFAPVAHIEGSFTNVVGLPSAEVQAALRAFGFSV